MEQGEAAQLCVYLGYQYLYLGVLRVCLGMGVQYACSSLWNSSDHTNAKTQCRKATQKFALGLSFPGQTFFREFKSHWQLRLRD